MVTFGCIIPSKVINGTGRILDVRDVADGGGPIDGRMGVGGARCGVATGVAVLHERRVARVCERL